MKKLIILFLTLLPFASVGQVTYAKNCINPLPLFEVRKNEVISSIKLIKDYYFNPQTPAGSFEQRKQQLDSTARQEYLKYRYNRIKEYQAAVCHFRGDVISKPDVSVWATFTCDSGFVFLQHTFERSSGGDIKEGPLYNATNTQMSWRTKSYRKGTSFTKLAAGYSDIEKRVSDELNDIKAALNAIGIPTTLPN